MATAEIGAADMENEAMTSAQDMALEVRGLEKVYRGQNKQGAKHALKGIDLSIPRGSIFGLLGPNGAGKSTLINIMAGLVIKTGGVMRICGYDIDKQPRQARAAIGIVPQELNLDAFFTPREMLELQAGLYGVPKSERRTDALLELVGLGDKGDAYSRTLSGGMRRRLMVAKAMVHNPPVLVLDEPTAGVDIELRQSLWQNVRALNARGTTVLLTTHYLEEAEELCDTIAIINKGEVAACEPTPQLLRRIDDKTLVIGVDQPLTDVPEALRNWHTELSDPQTLRIQYEPSEITAGTILNAIRDAGLTIVDVSTVETDLEDIFLQLTQGTHEPPEGNG